MEKKAGGGEERDGDEVGRQKRKRTQPGCGGISAATVAGKDCGRDDGVAANGVLGFGDRGGIQGWLDDTNWFGDGSSVDGGQNLQLWGNNGGEDRGRRVEVGGSSEAPCWAQCGYSEDNGASRVGVLEGKGSEPWFVEEGSAGVLARQGILQVGGSCEVACGNGGMIGDEELIESLFGEVSGANESKGVPVPVQGLFGEFNDVNIGEGIQCWCGEADCASLDSKGIKSLFGEIAGGDGAETFASEGNQGGCIENGDCGENVDVKCKPGRPKGSKNTKRGRPTDSNCKKNRNLAGVYPETPTKIVNPGHNLDHGVVPLGLQNGGDVFLSGEEVKEMLGQVSGSGGGTGNETPLAKRKRGRPKGSKNKKKSHAAEENQGMVSVYAGVEDEKADPLLVTGVENLFNVHIYEEGEECLSKSSKNENGKFACIDGTWNKTFMSEGLGNEGTIILGQDDNGLPGVTEGSGEGSRIVITKGKRGRPKGSKNKRKNLYGEENKNVSEVEGAGCVGGGDGNVYLTSSNSQKSAPLVSQADNGMFPEASGASGIALGSLNPKGTRGRPKSANKAERDLVGGNQENAGGRIGGDDACEENTMRYMGPDNEGSVLMGQESKRMPCESCCTSGEGYENVQPKRKRGRPKKKTTLADQVFNGVTLCVSYGSDNTIGNMAYKDEGAAHVGDENKGVPRETSCVSGEGNDYKLPKRRPGRPKGSKNIRKIHGVSENRIGDANWWLPGSHCGDKILRLGDLENERNYLGSKEDNETPTGSPGANDGRRENDQPTGGDNEGGTGNFWSKDKQDISHSCDKLLTGDRREGESQKNREVLGNDEQQSRQKHEQGQPRFSRNQRTVLIGQALEKILVQKNAIPIHHTKIEQKGGEHLGQNGGLRGNMEDKTAADFGNHQKRGRGRPKKSIKESENSGFSVSLCKILTLVFLTSLLNLNY